MDQGWGKMRNKLLGLTIFCWPCVSIVCWTLLYLHGCQGPPALYVDRYGRGLVGESKRRGVRHHFFCFVCTEDEIITVTLLYTFLDGRLIDLNIKATYHKPQDGSVIRKFPNILVSEVAGAFIHVQSAQHRCANKPVIWYWWAEALTTGPMVLLMLTLKMKHSSPIGHWLQACQLNWCCTFCWEAIHVVHVNKQSSLFAAPGYSLWIPC